MVCSMVRRKCTVCAAAANAIIAAAFTHRTILIRACGMMSIVSQTICNNESTLFQPKSEPQIGLFWLEKKIFSLNQTPKVTNLG